jgi:tRNA threonylcarbamoyl adenosine modification protein YeaZ
VTGAYAPDGLLLAIDTATRTAIVAVGPAPVAVGPAPVAVGLPVLLAASRRAAGHRAGVHLAEQIDEALADAGAGIADVAALVVGTGPGSFTGLRVGLATAKTLAYVRGLPLVGIASTDALRHAARQARADDDPAVVLPAGARDHYLARAGEEPVLVAPGGLLEALGDRPVLGVDLDPDLLGTEAARLGEAAVAGLPAALLELGRKRLAGEGPDDATTLVPAYVALPRGVSHGPEELGWSPDLR